MRSVFLDYDARRTTKTKRYCVRCQRDLKPGQPARVVRVLEAMVLHPEDAGTSGEEYLIGMDCAKIIGMEFSRPEDPI